MADRVALDSFFARQASRVRSGAFFDGAGSAADAIARADRAMSGFRFGAARTERARAYAARAWVTADDGAQRFAAGVLEAAGEGLRDAVRDEMFPLVEHAIEQWPTKTGASKSALALDVDVTDAGLLTLTFIGGDPKTFFVRYAAIRKDDQHRADVIAWFRTRMRGDVRLIPDAVAAEAEAHFREPAVALLRIWNARARRAPRRVYLLPSGGDAAGLPAWHVQAQLPFRPMVKRLAARAGVKIGTRAKAFTETSK